jgi:steroid delta-isomerase-like uncharacterized protein
VTREEIADVVNRRRRAMLNRDAIAVASLYAESCVLESPTAGGAVTGRAAIAQVHQTWFNAFPDVALTFDEPLIDGNRVVQTITSVGTDTGQFLGLPPTGKPFRVRIVFMTTVKDHLIVHEQRVFDFTGMLVQIGVLKAKPA